ncbi:DUF3127 domain-containing protein [Chitinophaga sp. sic0106]|uniref:DUF3127 domain-containing protein n=1 Tax=Chitinophaga sp. sic0106 TaxID=2854785 RepID=UPI001C44C09A|nr:DUF3127 domain-containing protein [Chitinophaga sp. sic0106]MBV7534069.1 DUF3127 domain-containing protein [Chitinophaga sp. sic0106]
MSDQAKITLTGEVQSVKDAVIIGNFEKRELWLKETTGDYPQTYCIEFHQNNTSLLDKVNKGDHVEIGINLRGRHWTKDGREGVMNTLQGWRIKVTEKGGAGATAQQPAAPVAAPAAETSDDLPF